MKHLSLVVNNECKIGDRVELIAIHGKCLDKLPHGAVGTVTSVNHFPFIITEKNDQKMIWVNWDCGKKTAIIWPLDSFKKIS